jgi:Fe-S oxidoreductase
VLVNGQAQAAVWSAREAALGSSSRALGGRTLSPGWEDSSVHPDRLADYLAALQSLLADHRLEASLYGHFGEGCVHGRISFDLETSGGIAAFRRFIEDAAHLVTAHGGSLSGEHGDGQARGELLGVQFGPALVEDFRRFKHIWDPDNLLNPGKLVDARPFDEDLRTESRLRQRPLPDAARRCVGAGRCLASGPGVMCPSYRASRTETETTRGRARLLFELASGGSQSGDVDYVADALLTCLGCKACKTECPAGVDMADAKSQFNAQRYAGRLRPRVTVLTAFAPWFLRAPSPLRALAVLALERRALGALAGRLAGFERGTVPPTLARETFTGWFARQPGAAPPRGTKGFLTASAPNSGPAGRRASAPKVLLWPDTFHNHFAPEALVAAARLLWSRGAAIVVPSQPVCCGRTLIDGGFREHAFGTLAHAVSVMADAQSVAGSAAAGPDAQPSGATLVVVLEPSCLAMFRDELAASSGWTGSGESGHFSHSSSDHVTWAPVSLSEALEALPPGPGGESPTRGAQLPPVLLHGHCHQTALWGMDAERRVLEHAGYEVVSAPAGCCGMAGAFGLDSRTASLGRAVGELGLLPAVRAHQGLVVANGQSCREQVRRQAGVRAVHVAEALWQSTLTDTDH